MAMIVKYANAYLTDRLYGGPEEGGWWYDCGEPVMSLPFICDESEETTEDGTVFHFDNNARNLAREQVYNLCKIAGQWVPEFERLVQKDWSLGDFAIYIEDKPGEYFPQERPIYE